MSYQPIESYGLVGDLRTAALIGTNGSVDWMCFPHFDSPSVFAAILDDEGGGRFVIAPAQEPYRTKQLYWPDTNVLLTRFLSASGMAEVTDFMPVGEKAEQFGRRCLVRRVRSVRGTMTLRMRCLPAFDFARAAHGVESAEDGVWFRSPRLDLVLESNLPLVIDGGAAAADFTLTEGQVASFVLGEPGSNSRDVGCSADVQEDLLKGTVDYWQGWLSKCTYHGRWREMIHRSALVLKLLTFDPTGAIVAAPTCGLPEEIGGTRNWDYRYAWIRDAAFTLYALLRIGFTQEATSFMGFLATRCHQLNPDGSLPVLFSIDGRHLSTEEELDNIEGYRGSRPIRVGNNAVGQLQLDIYGELMDAVYLYNKHGSPISYDFWVALRRLIDWLCDNWHRQDEGIWETRGGRRHWVYSKLMCWVAVDRALRLADKRSFPADRDRWLRVRDEIYEEIMARGWSNEHRAFMQSYDSDTLDASSLMMPLVFFVSPLDPKMLDTIDAVNRSPERGGLVAGSLVYRYNRLASPDGLPGDEGTFNICSFWLVEALTRAGATDRSRLEEARLLFESMLGYANHLGLFAEETSRSGEALGNFPQAFTHLALISAAVNLDRALGAQQ
ncbi:MAG TPA: glycoside hydrolase family 15 protein [Acidimicrobiales bacterium]|nr:glycoside hydrolase family 15 protein [Acidimicrobiales bacterium]